MCVTAYDPKQRVEIETPRTLAAHLGTTPADLVYTSAYTSDPRAAGWEDACLCHCDIRASVAKFGWRVVREESSWCLYISKEEGQWSNDSAEG